MNKEKEEVEIDLLELGKKLWDNKKFIIKCSIVGAVIGLVIAFSIPKEYTTTVILTTESGKSAGGSMGALASMAGINLGNTGTEDLFSPDLYSDVLNSTPFAQGLLHVNVVDQEQNINTSLYDYLKNEQKSTWWSYIFKIPRAVISLLSDTSNDALTQTKPRYIPKEEMELIKSLKSSYSINVDKKTGVIAVDVIAQSPSISAFMADTLTAHLQLYIIEQRTKKAKTDLTNSKALYDKAKKNYYASQEKVASFADANMNVISAKYKINQEKLQNEATIAYSVYNQMAQQVQMNEIKVQDHTPVFTIIQPAIEPLSPARPNKKIILIAFIFLAIVGASTWILGKDYILQLKNND